jgi:hypothetical protein
MKKQKRENGIDLATANGATELEAHIQYKLGGQVRDFQVVIADQGLVLRGRARTYYAKQLAQHAVLEVTPVPILANEIEVP